MRIRMLVEAKGAMYGLQNDVRIFQAGHVYTEGVDISPCLVKAFGLSGIGEILDDEPKAVQPLQNKAMQPPQNKAMQPPQNKVVRIPANKRR